MKRFNRIFACLLAVALLACACSGCGKKSEEPSVNGADAKNERYYAPLTGEPLSSKPANTRPFAVMINMSSKRSDNSSPVCSSRSRSRSVITRNWSPMFI